MRFGEFLIMEGRATEEQVTQALAEQRRRGLPLGELAVRDGAMTPQQLKGLLDEQLESSRYRRLGRLACDAGYLTESRLVGLLREQRSLRPRLGELMVELGVLEASDCQELADRHRRAAYGMDWSSDWPAFGA